MLMACLQILPVISIDLGKFLSSPGLQNILRFLHLTGGDFPHSSDKTSGNPRVSKLWRDQIESKDKCFNSTHKGIIYQVVINHN